MKLTDILTLCSVNLPTGAFGYSQGLESLVEHKLISDEKSFYDYLKFSLYENLRYNDLPLLIRLFRAQSKSDISYWSEFALASRNTKEARDEELNKGKAFIKFLQNQFKNIEDCSILENSYLSAFALYCKKCSLSIREMLIAYMFCFVEGQCMNAIKTVPIGQSKAWEIISDLSSKFDEIADLALVVLDEEIGSALCKLSILQTLHEDQYSRIFRS